MTWDDNLEEKRPSRAKHNGLAPAWFNVTESMAASEDAGRYVSNAEKVFSSRAATIMGDAINAAIATVR